MSHPPIEPASPAIVLARLASTAAAIEDHPEMYATHTLRALLAASKRLAQAAGMALVRRMLP